MSNSNSSADIEQNGLLAAVYVGEQTPIERLRNKLTPFFNLAAMLYQSDDLVLPFVEDNKFGKQLNELFYKELEQCKLNADDIHKYLSDCEVFYNRS